MTIKPDWNFTGNLFGFYSDSGKLNLAVQISHLEGTVALVCDDSDDLNISRDRRVYFDHNITDGRYR